MRWRRWTARGIGLLVLVALVTVSGALSQAAGQALQDDPRAELRRQMDEAEQRWQASGITSYQIVVRRLNGPWQIQWNTVVVRDGQIVESSARCGRALAGPDRCQVQPFEPAGYTVPGLFATARKLLDTDPAVEIGIRFDPADGHPRQMFRDMPQIVDDQQFWAVESLTPL